MKRRDFVLSCLSVAGGAFFLNKWPFLKESISLANDVQTFWGESPVPEIPKDVTEKIQNGTLLLKNETGQQIVLNDVGAVIWKHIDGNTSCREIAYVLTGEFHIDEKRASRDVEVFVIQLEGEGFLQIPKKVHCYAVKKVVCERKSVAAG